MLVFLIVSSRFNVEGVIKVSRSENNSLSPQTMSFSLLVGDQRQPIVSIAFWQRSERKTSPDSVRLGCHLHVVHFTFGGAMLYVSGTSILNTK